MAAPVRRRARSWRPLLLAAAAIIALLALLLWGRQLGGLVLGFTRWVDGLGPWAAPAFVLGYALATVAFVPGSLLTLAAGAVFGVVQGVALVFVGATLGATGAFLVARYLARSAVQRRVERDRRFAAVDDAIAVDGLRVVFLLRLSPLFPFNLLNYVLGLTRVRLVHYVLASVGMLPGILLYVYSGRLVGDLAQLATGESVDRGVAYFALLGVGLAATAVVTVMVTRRARRALREAVR